MDAPLKELGAIWFQQGDNGEFCVITHASRSLCQNEKHLCKLQFSQVRTVGIEMGSELKVIDCLLGSKYIAYTDNKPLMYVHRSKLRTFKIWWLCELDLFNFPIKYKKRNPIRLLMPRIRIHSVLTHLHRVILTVANCR